MLNVGISLTSPAVLGATRSLSPLVDENGAAALLDLDIENGLYWYNGVLYTSAAALNAVIPFVDNGDGTFTVGPFAGGQPFPGYSASAGTVVCEWINTSTTQSLFVWTIQASSNANYWRRLTLDGSNRPVMQVNNGSAAQCNVVGPAGATEQTNFRFRACDVMASGDFSSHINGELMDPANPDTSGLVSGVSVAVSVQIGHRAGSSKLIGSVKRWTYFPRAVSMAQRYALSQLGQTVAPGGRTWFSGPIAFKVGSDVAVASNTQQHGSIVTGKLGTPPYYNANAFGRDDHNVGALLRRSSDGRLIRQWCLHAIDNHYYQAISTNPDDISAWGATTDIGAMLGGSSYTYSRLIEIPGKLVLLTRCDSGAGYLTWHYSVSTDNGANWSTVQQLFAEPSQRSYTVACAGPGSIIHIICNDGHPNEFAGNSTYHLYFDGSDNTFHKSDGTLLGVPPYRPQTDLTRIYDGTGGRPESWVHDISWDGSALCAVFTTYPDPSLDQRYVNGRLNAGAWSYYEICQAGGSLYPLGDDTEKYYPGGACVDPDNSSILYTSCEVGTGGPHRNGGWFQLFKNVTSDGGQTFNRTQLTFEAQDHIRPVKAKNSNELHYETGTFLDYRNLQTRDARIMV